MTDLNTLLLEPSVLLSRYSTQSRSTSKKVIKRGSWNDTKLFISVWYVPNHAINPTKNASAFLVDGS